MLGGLFPCPFSGESMRKQKYKPTRFMAKGSHYDENAADFAVRFVESLKHTKGRWHGVDFKLIGWQEEIIRDLFGVLKKNGLIHLLHISIYKKITLKGMYAPLPRVSGVGSNVIDAMMDFQNFCLLSRVNAL